MARARKRKPRYFWHVPDGCWYGGSLGGPGIGNVANDIIVPLVDTEELAGAEPTVPNRDEFVVERIVGQWLLWGEEPVAYSWLVHERYYVTQGTAATLAIRDLAALGESDTSFLFHRVNPHSGAANGNVWGSWTGFLGGDVLAGPPPLGFRDIRVGRRISEGEALIMHLQLAGNVHIPEDESYQLYLWLRMLIREG